MKTAIYNGKLVTPAEFETAAGHSWRDRGLYASCHICESKATPVATHSLKIDPHFRHEKDVENCPYASNASDRYFNLIPSDYDPDNADRVKQSFRDEFGTRTKQFIMNMTGSDRYQPSYTSMLNAADRLRIWEYREIQLWSIPFILLTLIDINVSARANRPAFAFQFRFNKSRKSDPVDVLWTNEGSTSIEKVFIPKGKRMDRPEGNPWPVSQETLLKFSQ